MAIKTMKDLPLLENLLIFILITAQLPNQTDAFSINLIPIDSIDSPLFPKNLTKEERHQKLSELTITRAQYHLRTMDSSSWDHNSIRSPVFRVLSNYYVTQFRLGSQNFQPYLMIDTGCDDSWIQCENCRTCFEIKGGSFKYQSSSTFHYLPCDHPLCVPKLCQNNFCVYDITYLGTSSTKGVVSTDTFSFLKTENSSSDPFKSFPNVAFGCGYDNQNMYFGNNRGASNVIAGIFGLGFGKRSILMQLESETHAMFSYCLPSWTTPYTIPTLLRFGNDAKIVGDQRRVQKVRMSLETKKYSISLSDISVNGKRLRLNPAMLRGRFVIDSGAPYSVLVKDVYIAVRNEMVEYFHSRYGWSPSKQGKDVLPYDLCYDKFYIRQNYTLPTLTFHFGEASLFLQPENLFEQFKTRFCLIIHPIGDPGPSLLGAFQQANHRFLYDVKASTLSFVPENCQNN